MVGIVEQVYVEADAIAERVKQLWCVIEIFGGGPDGLSRQGCVGRLIVHITPANTVGFFNTWYATLCTDGLIAKADIALDLVKGLSNIGAISVSIHQDPLAALATQ